MHPMDMTIISIVLMGISYYTGLHYGKRIGNYRGIVDTLHYFQSKGVDLGLEVEIKKKK
tara:strand:+ start:469 stop:645 length:177 start_codon:yes stop_codon:yes gene_type:complete